MAKEYDTPEDAAAALQAIVRKNPVSKKYEFSSVIYQDPKSGKYKFTEPQSSHKTGDVNIKVRIPRGSLRAIFHNHPEEAGVKGKRDSQIQRLFSGQDVSMAEQLNVPSFIDVNNELLMHDPQNPGRMVKMPRRGMLAGAQKGAEGRPVLAQIPQEAIRRRRASRQFVPEQDETKLARAQVQATADRRKEGT